MSKSAPVVDGEASESDSEIEIGKTPDTNLATNSDVFVISGEAPESDDDSKISPPQCLADLDLPLHSVMSPSTTPSPTAPNKLMYKKYTHNGPIMWLNSKISPPQCLADLDLPLHSVMSPSTTPSPTTPNKLMYKKYTHNGPIMWLNSKISPPQCLADLDLPLHSVMSPPTTPSPTTPNKLMYTSLLHQKLWECNISLRATIEGLVRHTTDISVEKLSSADKTLLNVQECMRATNANLTLARGRLKQVHAALEKANCSAALPTVKVKI